MYGLENISRERLEGALKVIYSLEFLGVQIEDTKENDNAISYFFTVPETSTIDVGEEDDDTKSSEGLIKIAKDALTNMILDIYKYFAQDDDFIVSDFLEDFNANPSEYVRFYAKVRTGEIWSQEKGVERMNEILEQFKVVRDVISEWKEV